MARVALVDDHALFRLGIKTALSMGHEHHEVVIEAGTGAELFERLEKTVPDLLLLDLILPDMDGRKIAQRMRTEYPGVKILILSSESSMDTIAELVDIGIDGFIAKDGAQRDLPDAIRTIMDGEQFFGSKISAILHDMMYGSGKSQTQEVREQFSTRELQVLELCCEGKPTKIISEEMGISPRTVETHKAHIFTKLGINNVVELVRYAVQHGLIAL